MWRLVIFGGAMNVALTRACVLSAGVPLLSSQGGALEGPEIARPLGLCDASALYRGPSSCAAKRSLSAALLC